MTDGPDPPPTGLAPLHAPDRRLDLAFAALAVVPDGALATCLVAPGEPPDPPPALRARLPQVRWLATYSYPLALVAPDDHLRIHQAWLTACQGPDRIGQAVVRTTGSLRDDAGAEVAAAGWYRAEIIDLAGAAGLEAVLVCLVPSEPEPAADLDPPLTVETTAGSWFQGTSTFRVRLGPDGEITGVTPNVEEVLGRSVDEVVGSPMIDLAHPDDRDRAVERWRAIVSSPGHQEPVRARLAVAGGEWRWFEATSWNLRGVTGDPVVISDFRDVQADVEVQEARDRTERAHDRLARVLDEVDDMVMVGGLDRGLIYLNTAAAAVLGDDVLGTHLTEHVHPALAETAERDIIPSLRRLERWTGEVELEVGDERRLVSATVTPVAPPGDDDEIWFGMIVRDVTTERAHARDLAEQARHDPLTGLPNRLALMEQLERCRTSGPPDSTVAVCFIDLDNLKIVNDGLGHSVGDQLLRAVGAELLEHHHGSIARFGGDEFVVVLEDVGAAQAEAVAATILATIQRSQIPGAAARVTASIGVAVVRRDQLDPEGVIRDADAAMYVAKRSGRARVVRFDDAMRRTAERRFHLETALRGALDRQELSIAVQPVVSLETGELSGFEALSRWSEARPSEFIPVAEESGLITRLGWWALRTSALGLRAIQAVGPELADLRIGVNVSGHQLLDPDFARLCVEELDDLGVAHDRVVLELTESVLIDQREEIDRVLRQLRDSGIRLALDDFGSGYSSLGYLRRYPIDVLKLDTSYTQGLLDDVGTRIITEGVVTMASRLGLQVVAEGVEDPAELAVVRELGIDLAQGNLIGEPISVPDTIELLRADGAFATRVAAHPPGATDPAVS